LEYYILALEVFSSWSKNGGGIEIQRRLLINPMI
jgi:hypothetical protein